MMLSVLSANAVPVHYFTRSQAHRAASFLNRQAELMIYCGYDYELPTYVLLNEAWAEPVNATYYELWLYGYDAYTGEEVMMPVDLQCVWLQHGGDIYNAAQHLHFRTTNLHTPPFAWAIPEYLPYVRTPHPHDYTRTYHYTVHTYGWMPPAYTAPHPAAAPQMHPYYMRPPSHPAPRPTEAWQPGSSRPHIVAPDPTGHTPTRRTTTTATPTQRPTSSNPPQQRTTTTTAPRSRSTTTTTTTTTTRQTTNTTTRQTTNNNRSRGSSSTSTRRSNTQRSR